MKIEKHIQSMRLFLNFRKYLNFFCPIFCQERTKECTFEPQLRSSFRSTRYNKKVPKRKNKAGPERAHSCALIPTHAHGPLCEMFSYRVRAGADVLRSTHQGDAAAASSSEGFVPCVCSHFDKQR